jgi:hypothetical protein
MTARLDHVGLAVADLGAAAAWYCDVFGLVPELSLRVDAIDLSIEMLIHPRSATASSCCTARAPAPRRASRLIPPRRRAGGVRSRGLRRHRPRRRIRPRRRPRARPVMPPCPAPEPGVRMAFVADPEGNLVELLDRGSKQ